MECAVGTQRTQQRGKTLAVSPLVGFQEEKGGRGENPLFKQEYKKMGETYEEWIRQVKSVLEHVECETGEIKP